MFGPSGFWTMAPLCYAAKLDPFLSLDCARVEGKFCRLATLPRRKKGRGRSEDDAGGGRVPLQLKRKRGKTRRTTDGLGRRGRKGRKREKGKEGRQEELLFVLVEFLFGLWMKRERESAGKDRRRGN